jgi:hypothetical protein
VMVTLAVPLFVLSAAETAFTVTVAGLGTAAGAVYRPALEIVPADAFPPLTPLTCQVTAVLVVLPTAAVNCCVCPVCNDADPGLTLTVTAGGGLPPPPPVPALEPPPHPARYEKARQTAPRAVGSGFAFITIPILSGRESGAFIPSELLVETRKSDSGARRCSGRSSCEDFAVRLQNNS